MYRITLHVMKNSTAVIEESIMVSDVCTDNDCRNNKAVRMNMKKSKAKYIISVILFRGRSRWDGLVGERMAGGHCQWSC